MTRYRFAGVVAFLAFAAVSASSSWAGPDSLTGDPYEPHWATDPIGPRWEDERVLFVSRGSSPATADEPAALASRFATEAMTVALAKPFSEFASSYAAGFSAYYDRSGTNAEGATLAANGFSACAKTPVGEHLGAGENAASWTCRDPRASAPEFKGATFVRLRWDAKKVASAWIAAVTAKAKAASEATKAPLVAGFTVEAMLANRRAALERAIDEWSAKTCQKQIVGVDLSAKRASEPGHGSGAIESTGDPNEPDWVTLTSGIYPSDIGTVMYAVGYAVRSKNMRAMTVDARTDSQSRLSAALEAALKQPIADWVAAFAGYHKDNSGKQLEAYGRCADVAVSEYLAGGSPIAFWVSHKAKADAMKSAYFILMKHDARTVLSEVRDEIMARARAAAEAATEAGALKGDAESMLSAQSDSLDKIVDVLLDPKVPQPTITIR